ncbi:MAG: SagB family peptide dehydrogenase [Burkholderiales bacterium]|nr:SagB family peptide dehydrogenase [Burkholderiales bacterium]
MPKILWVLSPLMLYAAYLAWQTWRGRAPSRLGLNIQTSLLLIAYLLGTASLGVFWVANQQLPVFDWHYLFGYCTLLLVAIHLFFNLPMVLQWLRRGPQRRTPAGSGALTLGKALGLVAVLAGVFWLGTRHGVNQLSFVWGAGGDAVAGTAEAVIRYHEFSSESRGGVFRRAQGVEWGVAPPEFKHYPAAPGIALEKANTNQRSLGAALRAPWPRSERLSLAELGELLHLASGVTARRGGNSYRAAPSSGALFPSELYLLVRSVQGLTPGLYHYDPERHRLELIAVDAASSAGFGAAEDADVLVLLTAVFRRTGYKYRDRAYRYAVADAGHLLENLRLAAHAAGMRARLLSRFDEAQAASALGVDGVQEGVLAIMDLRPAGGAPAAAAQPGLYLAPPAPRAADAQALGVTGMAQQATSLRLLAPPAGSGGLALPPPAAAGQNLYRTIVSRRSQRRYAAASVPLATLASILADLRQAPQLSEAIQVHLVVSRVAGLAPGVYRYLGDHSLALVRAGEFAAAAQSAALSQDVIGGAAVVLVLAAARQPMLADGARGYRHAYLEAGMVSERWLLGAVARGLAACPVGAFYDDEAAVLIGVDSKRHWVLHFAALGWPAGK